MRGPGDHQGEIPTRTTTNEKEEDMQERETAPRLVRDMTDEELAKELPCFVHHADAGGQCGELASKVVYRLNFCEAHGKEIGAGALYQLRQEAGEFFERFRNPHVPALNELVDQELGETARRISPTADDDVPYHRALALAYPDESIPESVRRQVENWSRDETRGMGTVEDVLLDSLATLHKILYIAYQDGETWLVENIEEMRQAEAARCSYTMRELSPNI